RGRFRRQLLHPARRRMDALEQVVERERAVAWHHDLAVDDKSLDFQRAAASTSSGKYRVSDRPDFDCRKISRPLRKRRQRKPSHFGSYCQPLPVGIWWTESASIDANGGRNLRPPDRRPSWPANVAGGSVEAAKGPDQNQNRNGNA